MSLVKRKQRCVGVINATRRGKCGARSRCLRCVKATCYWEARGRSCAEQMGYVSAASSALSTLCYSRLILQTFLEL